MSVATLEERMSRLEGVYEHLATKADIADLKAELFDKMNVHMRWMIGIQIASLVGIVAVLRLLE